MTARSPQWPPQQRVPVALGGPHGFAFTDLFLRLLTHVAWSSCPSTRGLSQLTHFRAYKGQRICAASPAGMFLRLPPGQVTENRGPPPSPSPGPLGLAAGPVPAEAQSESGSQLRRRCPGQGQTAARADSSARHTPPRPRSCSARRPGRPCAGSLDLGFALGPRPRDGHGPSPSPLSPARSHGTGAPVSALAGRVLSIRCPGEPAASSPARPGQRAPDPGRGRGEGDDVRAPVRERHQDPVERPRHPGVLRPQARVPALRLRQIVSGPGAGHGGLGPGRRGPRCRLRSWPQLSVGLRGPRSWKFISKESPQAQRPLWSPSSGARPGVAL